MAVVRRICRRVSRFLPVILVMGTIFFLSHQQGQKLPLPVFPGLDKLAHAFAYAVLAWAAIFAFPPKIRRRGTLPVGLGVLAFCILYGAADEYHQSFIPGRSPSPADLFADALGAGFAVYGWIRLFFSGSKEAVRQDR